MRPLIDLLKSNRHRESLVFASAALATIGRPALPELIVALEDDSAQVRGFALAALEHLGAPRRDAIQDAVPAVRKRLNDDDQRIRKLAREVLQTWDERLR